METLVRQQAHKIALSLNYDAEQEAVMVYGLLAIAQIGITLLIVFLLGLILGVALEGLTVCLVGSILRRSSGGAHARSVGFCTTFSIVFCLGAGLIAQWLSIPNHPLVLLSMMVIVFAVSLYFIHRYVPVDSPNKPITSPAKIRRMRKGSYITLAAYGLVSACFFYFGLVSAPLRSLGISLLIGLAWQTLTLTPIGAILLQKLNDLPKFARKESKP